MNFLKKVLYHWKKVIKLICKNNILKKNIIILSKLSIFLKLKIKKSEQIKIINS